MAHRIQVVLADRRKAEELRSLLLKTCSLSVEVAAHFDPANDGVAIVDANRLEMLDCGLAYPDRTVVMAERGDHDGLARAWNAGVKTVVFHDEPINTVVLAVMAAQLHARTHFGRPARPHPAT